MLTLAYTHSLACTSLCICTLVGCLQVGHTHNQLDGTFGLLARNVYGKQCGGTTARDVLSFTGFEKVCREILGTRLSGVTNIRGVFDFKTLLREVRPRNADKNIKTQFSLQLKVSEDGSAVVVRSKDAVNLRVNFGPWHQMLPHQARPDAIPPRDTVPPACEAKDWAEFEEEIVPSLLKFYKSRFRHPVHIPDGERTEMLQFLNEGPAPPTLPEWIEWDTPVEEENEVGGSDLPFLRITPVLMCGDRFCNRGQQKHVNVAAARTNEQLTVTAL